MQICMWYSGLRACIEARELIPEEPYEVRCDVHGSFDGPRTGRLRAIQQVCK
jgi:BRCA1-associated RING domain protein 1